MNAFMLLGLVLIGSPAAFALEKKPQFVRVGVYVLSLGKFDVSSGGYTIDFYLSMRSDAPIEAKTFEFINGRASSIELISDEPKDKYYRIQADLRQNVDLKAYPFDKHVLSLVMEEKNNTVKTIVYVPDEALSGIDNYVTFVGWELAGKPRVTVVPHEYALYHEIYSTFKFEIPIRRVVFTAILKAFMPVAFILLVGMLALMVSVDNVSLRMGMNTSTLLAAVMFHLNVTSTLPPLGYLTFADKFMFATYFSLILSLGSTLVLMKHTDLGDAANAKRVYNGALLIVPLVTIGMFSALFLFMRT